MLAKEIIIKKFPTLSNAAESRQFFRQLRAELEDLYRPQVVFDLSCVEHLTAQGVDLLVRCIDQIADRDGELKFAEASSQTQLVLELTQISGIAENYDSVKEAVESWKAAYADPIVPSPAAVPQVA